MLTGVDQKLKNAVVETWLPILRGSAEEDANWDWPGKAEDPCFPHAIEHVAIVVDDEVQGILVTSLPAEPPALSEISDLLYVEYIAAAPWNRKHLGPPRFKAVGPALLRHAVLRSFAVGREGRIGLHSEKQAESFYDATCKLSDRGEDLAQQLRRYYEGDTMWATQFLEFKR